MEFVDSMSGVLHPDTTLEGEGLGYDGNRQRSDFASDFGNDWSRTGSRSAAHACGDEDHVGTLEEFAKSVACFERSGSTTVGIRATSQAASDLGAELDFRRCIVVGERLCVRVCGNEFDSAESRRDHCIERVSATTADSDHFDRGPLMRAAFEFKKLLSVFGTELQEIDSVYSVGFVGFVGRAYCCARCVVVTTAETGF
jgi:hypothetical protein